MEQRFLFKLFFNYLAGLLYLMSAFLSPMLGGLIDLLGCNISFVLISVVTTLFSHALLAFSEFNPYYSIVPMGVGYSMLCSSLWPMIALSVPLSRQGTAFGNYPRVHLGKSWTLRQFFLYRTHAGHSKFWTGFNLSSCWFDCRQLRIPLAGSFFHLLAVFCNSSNPRLMDSW